MEQARARLPREQSGDGVIPKIILGTHRGDSMRDGERSCGLLRRLSWRPCCRAWGVCCVRERMSELGAPE